MEEYGFEAQVTGVVPVGMVPEGLRMDVHFEGPVTAGPLSGGTISGIDYLLIRPDGVGVLDAREIITGADGTTVTLAVSGFAVTPFPMPPLVELLDPSFTWPDADTAMHGSARLQSGAPHLQAVNRTVFGWTGTVNMATGRLAVAARSLAPAA